MFETSQTSVEAWSSALDKELETFCRERVYAPWLEVLRVNRGEKTTGSVPPFLGMGPAVPAKLLPWLFQRRIVEGFLGPELNMVTIVLNRARNEIVFLAAERAEAGTYLEMTRLEEALGAQTRRELTRLLQAGDDEGAFVLLHEALDAAGLGRFKPGLLKIADLYFFEAFLELSRQGGRPLAYAREATRVAHRVIAQRLLYFYPQVPLARLLNGLRRVLPPFASGGR